MTTLTIPRTFTTGVLRADYLEENFVAIRDYLNNATRTSGIDSSNISAVGSYWIAPEQCADRYSTAMAQLTYDNIDGAATDDDKITTFIVPPGTTLDELSGWACDSSGVATTCYGALDIQGASTRIGSTCTVGGVFARCSATLALPAYRVLCLKFTSIGAGTVLAQLRATMKTTHTR